MDAIVDFHNDILGLLLFISTFVGIMLAVAIAQAYKTPRPLNPRDAIDSVPLLE
jgi:hypothetical protein